MSDKRLMGMRYDGTFELRFLRSDEAVRSQGTGDGAIQIERAGKVIVKASVGEWIHRQSDESIKVFAPSQIDVGRQEDAA